MAEFSEVMKQAQRMCDAYDEGCEGCPLEGGLCTGIPREWTNERIAEDERAVLGWAAAHPEPQYPTWKEWLVSMGILITCDGHVTGNVLKRIPADIAEKLGIEPKEG